MRGYIGCHTHCNSGRTIDQQIGHPGGHNRWDHLRPIVIFDEIHGLFIEISQNIVGNFAHTDFGVTHGGGRITVHGAKVSLPIDQHIAQ